MKIMLVEAPTVTRSLQHLLSSHRYEVTVASVDSGLLSSATANCHLIVINTGPDQAKTRCQQLRQNGCQTPILLLLSSADSNPGITALKAGANDYVTQPVDDAVFISRVEFLLHRQQQQPGQSSPAAAESAHSKSAHRKSPAKKAVEAASELELCEWVNHAPVLIWVSGLAKNRILTNQQWLTFTGRTMAQEVGDGWTEGIHPEDRQACLSAYTTAFDTRQKIETTYRLKRFDGEYRWLLDVGVPRYNHQGEFLGYIGSCIDVSDRQQTENKLQQQLKRERLIAEITDSIRQTLDLDEILQAAVSQVRQLLQTDRVIIFRFEPSWQGVVEAESVAPQWTATMGLKIQDSCLSELYAKSYHQGRISAIADIDAADIDPWHRQLLRNFQVRANLVVPILQGENLWGLLIAHHCSGPRQWVTDSTQLLLQVAAQLGIAIQQAELYQKTREQAALIDISTDAIFVRDLAGRILFWSQGAERLYGWRAEEAIGNMSHQLLKKAKAELDVALNTTMAQGFWQGELTQSTKAGDEILVASRWTLVRDASGRPQSLLEVNTDITHKKRLEAQFYQAQRLESLGQLAGGIAHDLGNMLTPILGIAQLLRITQKDADDLTTKQLDLLESSARRGTDMVKQILTFAQGSPEDETIVDIVTLLQEVIDVARQGFPSAIEICQDIAQTAESERLLRKVSADSTHLHQVFMNLCINARDAMPQGGVLTIAVNNCWVDEDMASRELAASVGDYIVVTVADTGSGIAPEIRDRIFDPFFTTKSSDRGTGLGLATVSGIVKNAGGFLTVTSEVEKGTQIEVYLPALN